MEEKKDFAGGRQLTDEQLAITNTEANIKINAVAGSGKTTTVIEYAASRQKNSKTLYLAFNRSVRLEAERKFSARGLNNVKIETAHSLAFKHVVKKHNYKVRASGYKTHEIVDLLGLRNTGEKHIEYIIANHINKFVTYFCNSDKRKVQDLNYCDAIQDIKAKAFVRSFYKQIEDATRIFLSKMDKGEIEITHDFYLKKFQLSDPQLNYDYILFDEGQDASAAMLDIFLKQDAVKVIVGDIHQQIYSWRFAINSLAKTDFDTFHLSASFRFPQAIADLAKNILSWKKQLFDFEPLQIIGKGNTTALQSKATIARTNLGLLLKAIEFITDNRKVKHIYFEGNIHSYTYADDGASLYDVLNLYNGKHERIRDKLIRSMGDMDELEEYIKKTEDAQLGMMVEIVGEYGNEIPGIIKRLKDLHSERDKAEMIFSTVHRAKGMEYDEVQLVDDFVTEAKLEKLNGEKKEKDEVPVDIGKWNEEINLLYVAITRTRNKLHIPEKLLPKDFKPAPNIHVIKLKKELPEQTKHDMEITMSEAGINDKMAGIRKIKQKAYDVAQKRETYKDAYKPWNPELDYELTMLYLGDNPVTALADHFGRTRGAIIARLKKLNCYDDEVPE
jgi:superfamily I DNA/RNA helicase